MLGEAREPGFPRRPSPAVPSATGPVAGKAREHQSGGWGGGVRQDREGGENPHPQNPLSVRQGGRRGGLGPRRHRDLPTAARHPFSCL